MNNKFTPLEALERIKKFYPVWRMYNREDFNLIETMLKNYEKLTSKPVILYGRTHEYTQSIIEYICKNYKEVKITNIEDEKKLKALEIIKGIDIPLLFIKRHTYKEYLESPFSKHENCFLNVEKYNLVKEELL